jgi:hypothetical protein
MVWWRMEDTDWILGCFFLDLGVLVPREKRPLRLVAELEWKVSIRDVIIVGRQR